VLLCFTKCLKYFSVRADVWNVKGGGTKEFREAGTRECSATTDNSLQIDNSSVTEVLGHVVFFDK